MGRSQAPSIGPPQGRLASLTSKQINVTDQNILLVIAQRSAHGANLGCALELPAIMQKPPGTNRPYGFVLLYGLLEGCFLGRLTGVEPLIVSAVQ